MPAKEVQGQLIPIPVLKIKYKDIFELKEFYEMFHDWLMDNDWRDLEENSDHWETHYAERTSAGGAKELWIWWRLSKPVRYAPYLRYYLDIDFHGLGIVQVEIVKEGQKMKVQKAELEMKIKGSIELLYTSKFKESAVLRHLERIFTKRIYTVKSEREKELYQELHVLANFIKQWFKLKRYMPYEEKKGFYPSKAWPSHQK